ncbi:MAG: hypothetical protein ABIM89_19145 [Mycobacteriales bacterium]
MTPQRRRIRTSPPAGAPAIVFDAGALIELERGSRWLVALLSEIAEADGRVLIPAGALAQAWRGGGSARVSRVAHSRQSTVVSFDAAAAYAVGELLAESDTSDVVDASVVVVARFNQCAIITSDLADLRALDGSATLFRADTGRAG